MLLDRRLHCTSIRTHSTAFEPSISCPLSPCSYWHERGLRAILLTGLLNLLALAFTAAFSTFLLLFVDWRALHTSCLAPKAGGTSPGPSPDQPPTAGGCDLLAVAIDRRPLLGRGLGPGLLALSYIAVCVSYLGWTALHFLSELRDMREVAHFMASKLGISESKVRGACPLGKGTFLTVVLDTGDCLPTFVIEFAYWRRKRTKLLAPMAGAGSPAVSQYLNPIACKVGPGWL